MAWFALRQGHSWALWALVAADCVFIGGWGLVFSRYAGGRLHLWLAGRSFWR
ncbi:MAG: hypothetical protein M3O91_08005 [Chloroflexota bacterium]|nr:hypothetical protein [Chloroflexota bacterium]